MTLFISCAAKNLTALHAHAHIHAPSRRCEKSVVGRGPMGCSFSSSTSRRAIRCAASEAERVEEMTEFQKKTAELLVELLKSKSPQVVAQKNADLFTEEFFAMSSTYMEMARKEGNNDMLKRIESALKIAMNEKGKTLRPEIQLLNQLLQQPSASERWSIFKSYVCYLKSDSYFFELLRMMIKDVGMQMDSPQKLKLMKRLEIIKKEADAISKTLEKAG